MNPPWIPRGITSTSRADRPCPLDFICRRGYVRHRRGFISPGNSDKDANPILFYRSSTQPITVCILQYDWQGKETRLFRVPRWYNTVTLTLNHQHVLLLVFLNDCLGTTLDKLVCKLARCVVEADGLCTIPDLARPADRSIV